MNMRFSGLLAIFTVAAVTIWFTVNAQVPASLVIISPNNETVVKPGQLLQVTVKATDVDNIVLFGTDPIAPTGPKKSSPEVNFSITIPATIQSGRYYLTASGTTVAGAPIDSHSVSLVVHPSNILSIKINPSSLMLLAPGYQVFLGVEGSVGKANDVKVSTEDVSFTSVNPKVASVDGNGIVTGQAAGTTQISAVLKESPTQTSSMTVTVGGTVRGDLNDDGKVDIDDLHLLQSVLDTNANGPNDARDLNHDGKIDALDARILVTLCNHPNCAYK